MFTTPRPVYRPPCLYQHASHLTTSSFSDFPLLLEQKPHVHSSRLTSSSSGTPSGRLLRPDTTTCCYTWSPSIFCGGIWWSWTENSTREGRFGSWFWRLKRSHLDGGFWGGASLLLGADKLLQTIWLNTRIFSLAFLLLERIVFKKKWHCIQMRGREGASWNWEARPGKWCCVTGWYLLLPWEQQLFTSQWIPCQ